MTTFPPPREDEIHAWGWDMGVAAGRRLADESDAFIGITIHSVDTPEALAIYGRAYLRAMIHGYRAELRRLLADRADIAANLRYRTPVTPPSSDTHEGTPR